MDSPSVLRFFGPPLFGSFWKFHFFNVVLALLDRLETIGEVQCGMMEHGGTHCFISPSFHFFRSMFMIAYSSNMFPISSVTTNRFCCLSCRSSRCLPVLSPPSTPAGCGGAFPPLHSSGKLESLVSGHLWILILVGPSWYR